MRKLNFKDRLDDALFGAIVRWSWPKYVRPRFGYARNWQILARYFVWQRVFRINGRTPWPVHFTSRVLCPEKITKGVNCDPGDSNNVYINAVNGIHFGSHIEIGPNTCIMSTNHDPDNYNIHLPAPPIHIGSYVWIGANVSILPGVQIGENCIIGAGSVVAKSIPPNSIAVGNPCRVVKSKKTYSISDKDIEWNR